MRNEIFLDFAENPDLAEVFARKGVGDKCCLKVDFQINQLSTQGVTGSVEKITTTQDYDSKPADKDKGEVGPNREQPVMVNIMGKMHKEASASAHGKQPRHKTPPVASSTPYSSRR